MKITHEKTLIRPGFSWRHYMPDSSDYQARYHYHHEYEFILSANYQGLVNISGTSVELCPFSLIMIPSGIPHELHIESMNNPNGELHLIWVDKDWLKQAFHYCHEMKAISKVVTHSPRVARFSSATARAALKSINELNYQDSSLVQLTVLFKFLSHIAADQSAKTLSLGKDDLPESPLHKKDKIQDIADYLEDNYNKDITLDSLAEHIHCSKSTLHRLFKKSFGECFSERLTKIRLSKAAYLLETTDLSINYICQSVGYHNASNFNRLFKAYKQLSPREYRKKRPEAKPA